MKYSSHVRRSNVSQNALSFRGKKKTTDWDMPQANYLIKAEINACELRAVSLVYKKLLFFLFEHKDRVLCRGLECSRTTGHLGRVEKPSIQTQAASKTANFKSWLGKTEQHGIPNKTNYSWTFYSSVKRARLYVQLPVVSVSHRTMVSFKQTEHIWQISGCIQTEVL